MFFAFFNFADLTGYLTIPGINKNLLNFFFNICFVTIKDKNIEITKIEN